MEKFRTLNEVLLNQPGMRFEINRDDQAQRFLTEFGLTGQIDTTITESRTQMLTTNDHKTHYFVIIYFTGKTVETDNGYLIYCLPKKVMSPQGYVDFLKHLGMVHTNVVSLGPLKKIIGNN